MSGLSVSMKNQIKLSVAAATKLYQRYLELNSKSASLRAQIAKLALDACDIRHGGHKGVDLYTIKKFAEDIGMSNKTLSTWVQIYSMGKRIDITEPSEEEWSKLRQAHTIEKHQNSKFAQKIGIKKRSGNLTREAIKKIVAKKSPVRGKKEIIVKKSNEKDQLSVGAIRFVRTLDSQQVNLDNYKKGDLQLEELELLKNYIERMQKRVNRMTEEG